MKRLLSLLVVLAPMQVAAQTVHSLDRVAPALRTPEARSTFAGQMAGRAPPNALGTTLPPGIDADQISQLLPGTGPLTGIGAKPWPQQAGTMVAIVCRGGAPMTGSDATPCMQDTGDAAPGLAVTVGVIALKPGAAPSLVAGPAALDGAVDWRNANLGDNPEALDDAKGDTITPPAYVSLDLAPYRLAPDIPAFGIRGRWSDAYGGGFGTYEALYLFAAVDGRLRQVLAVPMSAFKMNAGDWNKDGSRQHTITASANVLVVDQHATDGYADLTLRNRNGQPDQTWRWSKAAGRYENR